MRKYLLFGLLMVSLTALIAQTEDNVITGAQYANDVFYSLENGEVSSSPRNNWDIAFVTQVMSISILVNKGSYLNDGLGVELYTYPKGGISAWSTLDTTGMEWNEMFNDYESFENGAFTRNVDPTNELDFGWGIYNMGNHHIVGDSLFVIKTLGGTYKKLWIVDKAAMANTWIFKYANLDGSDEQEVSFNANDYKAKNFIYYSLDNKQFVDREPASTAWDLLFTNWGKVLFMGPMPFPMGVTGVLSNEYGKITTQKVSESGLDQSTADTYIDTMFISNPDNIGYNWKSYSAGSYTVSDSTVYFIKKISTSVTNPARKDTTYWKLYFTGFSSAEGKYTFSKTMLSTTVSSGVEKEMALLEVYPNPASDFLNLVYDAKDQMEITIFDTSGKLVYQQKISEYGFSNHQVNVSGLSNGIYFVKVRSGNEVESLKFMKK